MSANRFTVVAQGRTAQDAFNAAVEEAQHQHGHSGYSGTIADKASFEMVDVKRQEPQEPDPYAEEVAVLANTLASHGDPNVRALIALTDWSGWDVHNDKWGPAGCIQLSTDLWCFFGYAPT